MECDLTSSSFCFSEEFANLFAIGQSTPIYLLSVEYGIVRRRYKLLFIRSFLAKS